MDKIKRFIECLIPVTVCNLRCSYCYVIQRQNRQGRMAELKYTPEQIGRAMNRERWGGTCYFSICGAGETTLQKGLEHMVFQILKQGHYVNITTNGTVTSRIRAILEQAGPYTGRLHFAFSFHYLELQRLGLLDVFFENIRIVRQAGASFLVQFNLCDEYMPYLREMKELCVERTGAMPQVAATRKEDEELEKIALLTSCSEEEYRKAAEEFHSPLFEFTMKNFNVKRREFCYAGDWSAILDLSTGIMRRCYSSYLYQDIFRDPEEPIRFLAMGKCCGSPFCMNSSHFMALGVIPSVPSPSYAELRNRSEAGWYTPEMEAFLTSKLWESNPEYGCWKRLVSSGAGLADRTIRILYRRYKRYKKSEKQKTGSRWNIRRILPIEMNLRVRNLRDFLIQEPCPLPPPTGKKRYFFLDAASYGNLGDQAIALAMEWYLRDQFGEDQVVVINECDVLKYIRSLKKQIRPEDVIVLSGGGNMGDRYPRYEGIRRRIIRSFPGNRILIFPQTIDYSEDGYGKREKKRAMYVYGRHPRLTVSAREEKSCRQMKHLFRNVVQGQDIVFYLRGRMEPEEVPVEYDLGICLRDDGESSLTPAEREKIIQNASREGRKIRILTTMAGEGVSCRNFQERYEAVSGKLREFAGCRHVVTDRLHGMIFSVIAGTPCTVIDNRNHKVSGVFHMAEELCKNVHMSGENPAEELWRNDRPAEKKTTEKPENDPKEKLESKAERIRVLVINTAGMNRNGITQVIWDYYSRFDREQYQVWVLSADRDSEEVRRRFLQAGIQVRITPSRREQLPRYLKDVYGFMRESGFHIVHVHGNSGTMGLELAAARAAGCRHRIAHVHNSRCDARRADRLMRPLFYRSYTEAYACGQMAGEWMYGGRKYQIMKNGRDLQAFSYDPGVRERMRETLGLGAETLAVGHVGNFNDQKNHPFLLRVFRQIRELRPDARLYLAGYGQKEPEVRELARELGLEDQVVFLGVADNIPEILQAMDVMLLPSKYEGLPLVVIEWQIAALPCLVSDAVTGECAFSELVAFLSLEDSCETWAKTAVRTAETRDREADGARTPRLAAQAGYDIQANAAQMMDQFAAMLRKG